MTSNLPRANAAYAFACLCLAACGGPPNTDAPSLAHQPAEPAQPASAGVDHPGSLNLEVAWPTAAHREFRDLLGIEQVVASSRPPTDFLWDQDLEVREAALEVIINSNAVQHEHDLVLVMTDPDNELRETAVDLLTDRGGDLAIRLLRRAVYDPHPSIRQAAMEGLQELGAPP